MPLKKGVKSTVKKEPKRVAKDNPNTTKDDNVDIKDFKKV